MEEIKINQQSRPLQIYNNNITDEFPMKYYYSGYIYNSAYWDNSTQSWKNPITINFNLWTGELLPPITIGIYTVLYIEDLPIKEISISSGNYTYSFIGTYLENYNPKYKIDLKPMQSYIVGSDNKSVSLNLGSGTTINELEVYTSNTPNTITQITTTGGVIIGGVTMLADINNTDPIYVGNTTTYQSNFPLYPGASLTLFNVDPSYLGIKSTGSSQLLHVIFVR